MRKLPPPNLSGKERVAGFIATLLRDDLTYGRVARALEIAGSGQAPYDASLALMAESITDDLFDGSYAHG